ncbi:hypothetical protein HanIR_Chr14g0720441 [Helianthus annuus]|nr:hypothetical protein HanIR_Chr14g0720441 [Helianthus annuus]
MNEKEIWEMLVIIRDFEERSHLSYIRYFTYLIKICFKFRYSCWIILLLLLPT